MINFRIASRLRLVGLVLFAGGMGAAPASAQVISTFTNPTPITIDDLSPATPYPSTIDVTGLTGTILKVTATVFGFSHAAPRDVGALLVGPGGGATFLFDGPGAGSPVVDLTWTFDDDAAGPLPATDPLVSGTFQPNTYFPDDVFDPPAPGGGYAVSLGIFDGGSPNGTWSLFVQDFGALDVGTISGGWSLTITSTPEPSALALTGLVATVVVGFAARRRRTNPLDPHAPNARW